MPETKVLPVGRPYGTYIRSMRYLALSVLLFIIFTFVFISYSDLPGFAELENPKYDLASVIYDVKGVPFGRYYIEDRVSVNYEQLSPLIKTALLATEDDRFYNHCGIDLRAIFRVAFKTLILRKESAGGGSTISQQLAKLLYKRPDMKKMSAPVKFYNLVVAKLKEWVIAIKLEKSYTKEEIMAMYLNKFEFINGAHGIEAASQVYFNKSQQDMYVPEVATIIGMLKNPSYYNPKRFPERCRQRRNVVLGLLRDQKYINKMAFDSLASKEIDMTAFSRKTQSEGPAPYFRAELTKWLKELFSKNKIKKSDGTDYNIYTDGLKIYTTIDLTYQKYAEEAVWEHMKWNQERYWNVWKNKDPWTYEADDFQKRLRASILESQAKNSDRYLSMRNRHLGKLLADVDENFPGLPMSDHVIKALDSMQSNSGGLTTTSFFKSEDPTSQGRYRNLLSGDLWPELKRKYQELQVDYKNEFSTPVKMKVFDYNDLGEKSVEMSPFDSLRYHKMHLQAGFLAINPANGHVKAWVGGADHKYFKFDHVTMRRSVGSTMKPFVYTQAMAVANISPCQEFDDIQYTIAPGDSGFDVDKEWSPANATEEFTGNKYNLFHGLLYSKNSITVKLLKELGTVAPIRELLHNLGIDKNLRLENGRLAVPALPSICLGAVDLTLLEMSGAYSAFGNNGTYVQPVFVSKIEDKNGKIIFQGIPNKKSAINPLYNAVMVAMLKNNVGGRFSLTVKTKIGGKTGTTNDYADGWFMGVTPTLITGIWTGGDDKWIRFLTLDQGQGYVMARPIAELFLQKLERDENSGFDWKANFPTPPPGFDEMINCAQYKTIKPSDERYMLKKQKEKKEEFDTEF
jgi:penicillin-binding protein 1A